MKIAITSELLDDSANESFQFERIASFARGLISRGYSVELVIINEKKLTLWERLKSRFKANAFLVCSYEGLNFVRLRSGSAGISEFVRIYQPKIAICLAPNSVFSARSFEESDVPSILYCQTAELHDLGGLPNGAASINIASSDVVATELKDKFGILSEVIIPHDAISEPDKDLSKGAFPSNEENFFSHWTNVIERAQRYETTAQRRFLRAMRA
ncbi:MAG: hypothetical protein K5799_03910 [Erythrobacter sp.]|nr:hypothetical protein [Erythrobacter sp.]